LVERKRELLGLVDDTEEALAFLEQSRPHEWTEEAQEEALSEVLQDVDDRVWKELLDVERALVNVGNGTYGICGQCGSEIAPNRLEALPEARFCIACQGETESV
jgi:RNA polymerase-binding transcription factor DksA